MSPPPAIPRPWAPIAAGVVAGALIVGNPVGLGTFLSASAVGVAVAVQAPLHAGRRVLVDTALALSLAATAMVTAAGWALAVTLVGAFVLATSAVAGGPSWAQLAAAPVAPLRAAVPGARELIRSATAGHDLGAGGRSAPLLRGAGLALLLLTVFGTLFVSADRAFAELTERYLVPDIELGILPARALVGVLSTVLATALVVAASRGRDGPADPPGRRLGRTEWLTALGALDVLFLAFVAVQITVLFGGHTHVLETAGLTYAEYARSGFLQLLVVAGLTLAVIAGSVRWAERSSRRDRLMLQALLGVLCLLALVVLASALRRLGLYEDAFGLTRARLAAHAVLFWLGALFVVVMAAGVRWDGRWLPRASTVLTAVGLLALALVRPDALVAEHNVQRFEATGRIDVAYLDGLSADAVPALTALPADLRHCVLADDAAHLRTAEAWHAFNISRWRARVALEGPGGSVGSDSSAGSGGRCTPRPTGG